ncbi:hypothetical protein RchiOBHm_Chr4g0436701 [Rosa chinensis]|uniref:Uncharacterized protein n=1 Tax=Rosa chinensis TaxID=74649 RepID=A0A2P6R236_ROSCH|nr:hypothetical protein RchiOBHm_Chr4g0436701 [Rosa chinensis]
MEASSQNSHSPSLPTNYRPPHTQIHVRSSRSILTRLLLHLLFRFRTPKTHCFSSNPLLRSLNSSRQINTSQRTWTPSRALDSWFYHDL